MERIHLKFDSLYFNSIGAYLHDKASNLQEKVKTVFKENKENEAPRAWAWGASSAYGVGAIARSAGSLS